MTDKLYIPGERPLATRRLLNILNSGPKIAILKALHEEGSLTAKELSKILGVRISTILSHLSDLLKVGLIVMDCTGRQKKYRLAADRVVVEIDLPLFLHLEERIEEEELREIEELALRYMNAKRSNGGLPLAITVKDVASTLGLDTNTAIEVVDYINTYTDRFIEALARDAISLLVQEKEATLNQLARKLNIHLYWASLVAQKLVSKGYIVLRGDRIVLVQYET